MTDKKTSEDLIPAPDVVSVAMEYFRDKKTEAYMMSIADDGRPVFIDAFQQQTAVNSADMIEINKLLETKKEEYEKQDYARNRLQEYPNLALQIDNLFHDINNGTLDKTGKFFTELKAIKDKHPKPSE